jgi:hypothetical protein
MRYGLCAAALVFLCGCSMFGSSNNETLVLRNRVWQRIHVEAVITRSADCDNRGNEFIRTEKFEMGKDQTYRIDAPNGALICWRHDRNPNNPGSGEWSGWSKATLFPGESTKTDL